MSSRTHLLAEECPQANLEVMWIKEGPSDDRDFRPNRIHHLLRNVPRRSNTSCDGPGKGVKGVRELWNNILPQIHTFIVVLTYPSSHLGVFHIEQCAASQLLELYKGQRYFTDLPPEASKSIKIPFQGSHPCVPQCEQCSESQS